MGRSIGIGTVLVLFIIGYTLFYLKETPTEHLSYELPESNTNMTLSGTFLKFNKELSTIRGFGGMKGIFDGSKLSEVVGARDTWVLRPDVCSYRDLELVICVETRRTGFEDRRTIRQTWGSYGVSRAGSIALLFFLGSCNATEPPDVQDQINKEFNGFGDIVQGKFVDHYTNLTLKSVSVLHWTAEFCRHAKYIVKSDDDEYVNIPLLLKTLRNASAHFPDTPFEIGKIVTFKGVARELEKKHYVPKSVFPFGVLPPYAVGGCYAMTSSAAVKLRDAASKVIYIHIEDQFLGMCANQSSLLLLNDDRFMTKKYKPYGERLSGVISSGHFPLYHMRLVFTDFMGNKTLIEKLKREQKGELVSGTIV